MLVPAVYRVCSEDTEKQFDDLVECFGMVFKQDEFMSRCSEWYVTQAWAWAWARAWAYTPTPPHTHTPTHTHTLTHRYALRCGAVSAHGQLLIRISQLGGASAEAAGA